MNESGLMIGESLSGNDPFAFFTRWMTEARASEINDANAMALATVDTDGLPNVRMVLLNGFDERGFVFFTNYESAKGRELLSARKAAICFHWKSLQRSVRARGAIETVSAVEADAYFRSRPRGSQVGAWASEQSRPLESREFLEQAVAQRETEFGDGDVPRPDRWSGFRLIPETVEFWHNRPFRLHDRIVFTRTDGGWELGRLFP